MPAIILWLIESKLGRTVAISVAIFIGVGIGWLVFATHYENIGYAKAIHAIAAQDSKAISEAQHARQTVKDCRDSGHQWNVSSGMCE
jgi:hypothetical protein